MHALLGLASAQPLPVPEHPYAGDEGGDKALAGVAEEGQEDSYSAGHLPGGPSSDPLSFCFLMNDTHDQAYDTTLAPALPRKPFPASLRGQKGHHTYTLGRVCGRECVVWSAGPATGLEPIPGAATAPMGVASWSGGGGRGGFIVWRETKKKKQMIYAHLSQQRGGKRNQKPMKKDIGGIHAEQKQLPCTKASLEKSPLCYPLRS